MRIRPIPETFSKRSLFYTQIFREGDVAAYNAVFKESGKFACIEVIVIRTTPPHPKDKNEEGYDKVERYPAAEAWGKYGWTTQTTERANKKIEELLRGRKQENV
jgi:hypothetical protein